MKPIISRFSPSPTGFLHIGSLRTALFAYLAARATGGKFLLRIEDTDRTRLVDGATEGIVETLAWAGMEVDEGVTIDEHNNITQKGEHGPYIQSERKEAGLYTEYIERLLGSGDAYYAFDTPEELEQMRKKQEDEKRPPQYDRDLMTNQFTLGDEETMRRIEAGIPYVIRLKMPHEGITSWNDITRGTVEFRNELIDDQVLIKADGYPTYHFAVVVDDHTMGITHVIRGEEWISSTPKHIVLFKALGWPVPEFAHLPLLVNEQKQKLSKRHGDVSVTDFREKGYLVETIINFIAFLGWNPGDEREFFTLKELEEAFTLDHVGKAPAVFSFEKLDWYNKQYMMNMDPAELARRAEPFYQNAGLNTSQYDLATVVLLEQGRAKTLVELVEHTAFLFAQTLSYESSLLIWKKSTAEDAKEKLAQFSEFLSTIEWGSKESLEEKGLIWIEEHGFNNGDVLWPTRVALSGKKNSPGPFEIMAVLGKDKTLARIKHAIGQL